MPASVFAEETGDNVEGNEVITEQNMPAAEEPVKESDAEESPQEQPRDQEAEIASSDQAPDPDPAAESSDEDSSTPEDENIPANTEKQKSVGKPSDPEPSNKPVIIVEEEPLIYQAAFRAAEVIKSRPHKISVKDMNIPAGDEDALILALIELGIGDEATSLSVTVENGIIIDIELTYEEDEEDAEEDDEEEYKNLQENHKPAGNKHSLNHQVSKDSEDEESPEETSVTCPAEELAEAPEPLSQAPIEQDDFPFNRELGLSAALISLFSRRRGK